MEYTLELGNVSKKYADFHLENITLNLPKGSIMGLIGANGSGKSTTIKLILDMIKCDSGTIRVFGKENGDVKLREDIGVVFDENNFPDELSPDKLDVIMKHIYKNWDSNQFFLQFKTF